MNKHFPILLSCLFLFSDSHGQEQLEGAWGLKFGTSRDSVIIKLKKRFEVNPDAISSAEVLIYKNCKFGTEKADLVKLRFLHKRLFDLSFFFIPENDQEILFFYERLKEGVTEKYFAPQTSVESYKSPFEKGDKHEVTAIKGGYATIGSLWYFPASSNINKLET